MLDYFFSSEIGRSSRNMRDFLAALMISAIISGLVITKFGGLIGSLGFPLPKERGRIGCVDGLRGYLALSVMVHHFYLWNVVTLGGGSWSPPSINFINQLGASAVALFFMTTGLVFYPRIMIGWKKTDWVTIYVTRIARIFPLILFSVGIITLIIYDRTGVIPDWSYIGPFARWISTLGEPPLLGYADSGRINAYVLWSLRYEWIFYLLLLPISALMMDAVRRLGLPTVIVPSTLLAVALIARTGGLTVGTAGNLFKFLPLFAIGMLANECRTQPRVCEALLTRLASTVAVSALLLGMITTQFPYGWSLPLIGFFFICVACGNDFGGVLRTRGAIVLGECSFSIYLLHGIILDLMFSNWHSLVGSLPLVVVSALLPCLMISVVVISASSYLAIERPALALGKMIARRLESSRSRLGGRELDIAP